MVIRKVLLVDDEPDIRKVAKLTLERIGGWEVVVATSGAEAVATAARELPDVILLDVMMPDMDGPTTLAALRAQPATATIPVIFMTAKVQASERASYANLDIGVIAKPFEPRALPDLVRRLCGEEK